MICAMPVVPVVPATHMRSTVSQATMAGPAVALAKSGPEARRLNRYLHPRCPCPQGAICSGAIELAHSTMDAHVGGHGWRKVDVLMTTKSADWVLPGTHYGCQASTCEQQYLHRSRSHLSLPTHMDCAADASWPTMHTYEMLPGLAIETKSSECDSVRASAVSIPFLLHAVPAPQMIQVRPSSMYA